MHNKIFLYFIIYSFLGWMLESVYKTLIEKKLINSGFLYGPFCPIYGFGALFMIWLTKVIPNNVFLVFITCTIILTFWEYIVGVFLEKIFKTKYWDYSHVKFNFQGRICLKNSMYWGILGVAFYFIIHPFIEKEIEMIPENIIFYINIVIYLILLVDVVVTVTKILFIDKKIQQVNEIGEKIKEKINELKRPDILEKVPNENVTLVIAELKDKQTKIKKDLYKLTLRLKNAFPTMQSETISNFINQKMDLKNIRNKIRKNKGE